MPTIPPDPNVDLLNNYDGGDVSIHHCSIVFQDHIYIYIYYLRSI